MYKSLFNKCVSLKGNSKKVSSYSTQKPSYLQKSNNPKKPPTEILHV